MNIDKMHDHYGKTPGKKCAGCCNLVKRKHLSLDYKFYKCKAYGITDTIASNWRWKYDACGLFGKPFDELWWLKPLMEMRKSKAAESLEGQMSLLD